MNRALAMLILAGSAVWADASANDAPRKTRLTLHPSTAPAMPGFSGSAHDFYGPLAPLERRCAPCHSAEMPTTQPPLWDPLAATRRRLVSPEPRRRLAPSSLLCLSCHDGTIASEIVGGGRDPDGFAFAPQVDLPRDHPVGVEYPPLGRRAERIRRDYVPIAKLQAEGTIRLPDNRVECISCHDPHNALGLRGMLVKSDRRSALCLSCHIK